MSFVKQSSVLIALIACTTFGLQAQPGFGPGPSRGPGGPGGPGGPPGRAYPAGPGGPPPQMDRGRSMPPPQQGFSPDRGPGGPENRGIPSTRFAPIPNYRGENPMRATPPGFEPGGNRGPGGPAGSPVPPDTGRMQQALRQRDYATIGRESEDVRDRTQRLERMGPDMPMQDRLQVPLINHMYRQGAELMDEGRKSRDDAKIRMGIQQINQANEKLGRLKDGPPQGGRPPQGRGNNDRR